MEINQSTEYNRSNKFYLSQSEDFSLGNSPSDNSEELLQRSMVCSTVLHYYVRIKNIKEIGNILLQGYRKNQIRGFPGGSVVKNPTASAGDTGLISDPGRSHMLQSN